MSIKQNGGVFGRNPTFNDVTIEGELTFDGDIDINSDLKIDGNLDVDGSATMDSLTVGASAQNVGSVASPAIRLGDTDTGFYREGFNRVQISAGGKQVARFDSNGNISFYEDTGSTPKMVWDSSAESLGIGTASIGGSATTKLHLMSATTSSPTVANDADELIIEGSGSSGMTFLSTQSSNIRFGDAADSSIGQISYNHSGNHLLFGTNNAERARLTSDGALLVGTSNTPNGTSVYGAGLIPSSNDRTQLHMATSSTADLFHIRFYNPNGSVGDIRTNGSATEYNTSSDQRLKENIADADDSGTKVDAIQVRKYDWKADGSHQDYGMIAQELQTVAPEAVSGDANSDEMMGIDYSKLVPMMLKEIQSLRQRVASLEE